MAQEKEAGHVGGKPKGTAARRGVGVDDAKDLVQHLREDAAELAAGSTYVVESGDSLSKIAQELLGDAARWREIYEANKDQIEDPDKIQPGQELDIPS